MSDYNDFEVEDFAKDDLFIKWCTHQAKEDNKYWENVKKEFPQKLKTIEEASMLVKNLYDIYNEKEINKKVELIDKRILANTKIPVKSENKIYGYIRYIAASVIFIIASGIFYLNTRKNIESKDIIWTSHYNDSNKEIQYKLSDNSIITLEPYSSVTFPNKFSTDQRIVILKGEAFFQVAKDSLRPFLVYANETITKVLGTSFKISAFEGQKTVQVEVATGKVAVYGNVQSKKNDEQESIVIYADKKMVIPKPNIKYELTPNQKVIVDYQNNLMKKTLVDSPVLLAKDKDEVRFNFFNENISKVFNELEKAYGIKIEYESAEIIGCNITTKLADEPLLEKVQVLCAALNLQYKEENGSIKIYGKGCNS